jgi:hypothetical protein
LQFEDTLSDYTRLVDAVKDALNNRSQSLYMWQMAQKTVEQKREKQAKNNDLKAQREVEEVRILLFRLYSYEIPIFQIESGECASQVLTIF